jgi:DUF1680 family protein
MEIVRNDLRKVYLGNLGTIDADISLPSRGELGSELSWVSGQILFISHEGKVTRPSPGVGNRTVELVVTATLNGYSESRIFEANVLEEEYLARIMRSFPVDITVPPDQVLELPAVVVVQDDQNAYTVASVVWETIDYERLRKYGALTITGTIEGSDLPALARVAVAENASHIAQEGAHRKQVRFFEDRCVSLEGDTSFAQARDRAIEFLLGVDDDQMLYSFRVAAGLDTRNAPANTGWDAPQSNVRGHTTGHYLSSLALAYAGTANKGIKSKLDYMIEQLMLCQKAMSGKYSDGFLSAYSDEQFDLLEKYTTYPTIWAPYYTLHKILAGLRDSYLLAGNQDALDIYVRLGDWVCMRLSRLGKQQLQKMWSMYIAGEFGGMNEVMVDLYFVTGNERYIRTAKLFDNCKLFVPMEQNLDTLGTLHANQHIPQVIGALMLYRATGEDMYYTLASNFWHMVTSDHIYSIGGTGETEMFRRPGVIGRLLTAKTAESCASYNMMKLSRELFTYETDVRYMDYYERTMYNHILASGDSSGPTGGTTYFMPLAPGSRKSFDTVENTCCHGTGLENHLKYHDSIYAASENTLFVNMYIPSTLSWEEKSVGIQILTQGVDGKYKIRIVGAASFALKLRKPYWADTPTIRVDGEVVDANLVEGYYTLERNWNNNSVMVELPFSLWVERTPDVFEIGSLFYGPYVLAALSQEKESISVKTNGQPLNEVFHKTGDLEFSHNDIRYIPLQRINREAYHVYVRFI